MHDDHKNQSTEMSTQTTIGNSCLSLARSTFFPLLRHVFWFEMIFTWYEEHNHLKKGIIFQSSGNLSASSIISILYILNYSLLIYFIVQKKNDSQIYVLHGFSSEFRIFCKFWLKDQIQLCQMAFKLVKLHWPAVIGQLTSFYGRWLFWRVFNGSGSYVD